MRWRQKTGERAGPPAGPDLPGPRRAPDEPRAGVSAVAAGWLAGATQAGPQAGGRKEGLAIDVDGRIRSPRVIEVLSRLVSARGAPAFLRSDNGPGRCGMWGLRVPPRCITAPPGATAARSRPLKLTVVRRNRAGQDRVVTFVRGASSRTHCGRWFLPWLFLPLSALGSPTIPRNTRLLKMSAISSGR